jgi:hypothetical protein
VNTADLHPKRFALTLTVGQLRQLEAELRAMEHVPHEGRVPAEKQIERDRAAEQLSTALAVLCQETQERDPTSTSIGSLPLLRATAKYLFTACDRCRRAALRVALHAMSRGQPEAREAAVRQVRNWDEMMRQLGEQHGVSSPLRELVEPVAASPVELAQLGLSRDRLVGGEELLARF